MYKIQIDNEAPIFHASFTGDVSLGDFAVLNEQVNVWLGQADQYTRSVLVLNIKAASSIPPSIEEMRQVQRYASRTNLTWILVITDNKLHRLILMLALHLSRPQLQFFPSADQAEQFARRVLKIGATTY